MHKTVSDCPNKWTPCAIRRLRKKRGWTEKDLAKKVSYYQPGNPVSLATVCGWENGDASPLPSEKALNRLWNEMGIFMEEKNSLDERRRDRVRL